MANKKSKQKNGKNTTELEEVQKREKESIELLENQDDVYRAEVILKSRIQKGKVQYYVKWWGSSDCTWEPQANILDPRLLKGFKEKNQNKSKLNTGVERKNAKIKRPAVNTKNVEEKKRLKRFDNDKKSNKIKVRHANKMKGFGERKRPARLPLIKNASKVLQKNGNSTKMKVKKEQKIVLGGERKTRNRPAAINMKNNIEALVGKKKRGRPPVVKDLMKPVGNRCEDTRLLDYAKPDKEGICSSLVKVETTELNDQMDPPELGKMEIPKLVSEMESPEHDNKMESQGHNNEMDHNDTITLDDTCESVFESHIPELAKYFPSPATNHTHRLGYSSSGSDATSPNPVSRSHPPQESRVAGVDSSSRNSQVINGLMFSVAATPVTNCSRLPQSPLTTSAPGNTTRFSQSLQSVAAPSLGQNERTPQAGTSFNGYNVGTPQVAATLAIAPIVYNARTAQAAATLVTSSNGYNVGTPMAAAALATSSNGYHAGTPQGAGTMATSPSGYNAGIPYQLVLPLYDGHLQDAGYSAPDDSRMYGNSLFFEDTFDYS